MRKNSHSFAVVIALLVWEFIMYFATFIEYGHSAVPGPINSPIIAIINVNVVPMDVERILEVYTIIAHNGIIVEMGPADSILVPGDAMIIDGVGKYLMPGMTDAHMHLLGGGYTKNDLLLYLANGITTIRDMWDFDDFLSWREEIATGQLLGPTIYACSPGMQGSPPIWPVLPVTDVVQARNLVAQYKGAGYDFIKVYENLSLDVYNSILDEARLQNIRVAGHVSRYVGIERALAAGQASIEHLRGYATVATNSTSYYSWDASWNDARATAIAEATRNAGIWNVPTLTEEFSERVRIDQYLMRPELRYVSPNILRAYLASGNQPLRHTVSQLFKENQMRFVKKLHDVGAGLLLGTDTFASYSIPGFSIHEELRHMTNAGLTPYETLRMGTANAAEFLAGEGADFGTIAVNNRADLLLLNANPLADVGNVQQRAGVMVHGRWFLEAELQQMLEDLAITYDRGPADPPTPAEIDSISLIALFYNLGGENWRDKTNWLSGEPMSTWYGVVVNDSNRVTELWLANNNLSGILPPAIGNFGSLRIAFLEVNRIQGTIPAEFFNLLNLEYLRLEHNQISGEILDQFVRLENLKTLSIWDNKLTGKIPPELGTMTNLLFLGISVNQLTGTIPVELTNLANLEQIWLNHNSLTGEIPPDFGTMTNLRILSLSVNSLTGTIPVELGNLSNLEGLWLNNNRLTGEIPHEFGNLRKLKRLFVQSNLLTGAVPETIRNLTTLDSLRLAYNKFTDLPVFDTIAPSVNVWVRNNRFTFEDIEPNIGRFTTFVYAPQDSVGQEREIKVITGSSVDVSISVGGTANYYRWFKDGEEIAGAVDSVYTIVSADSASAGMYNVEITNSIATELTLFGRPITVIVQTESQALQDIILAVNDLDIPEKIANKLINKLENASAGFNAGDSKNDLNKIENFISDAGDAIESGFISGEEGQALITMAGAFIEQIIVKLTNSIDEVNDIINDIDDMNLPEKTTKMLKKPLGKAIDGFKDRNSKHAIAMLEDFTVEVNDAVQAGNLSKVNGQTLIEEAHVIMTNHDASMTLAKSTLPFGDESAISLPEEFTLKQNYPNPFNPTTTIQYQLPEPIHVSLMIYNILGQEVRLLVNQFQEGGYYNAVWDGKNDAGIPVPGGIYVYRIRAGQFIESRKLILLK